jgi:EAL and modified HD-GYP domain-containing signal transduction protein
LFGLDSCEATVARTFATRYNAKALAFLQQKQREATRAPTAEEFELCKQLDFDYYHGYFFCRPTTVTAKKLPVNRVSMLRLMSRLQNPKAGLKEIGDIIRTEPTLFFKLLRFANSAECGLTGKIESVQHAVALAGMRRIKTMASLSILAEAVKIQARSASQ